ncbi:putative spermidine/putrescine transport system permease protein [Rhizobiales bacterium GAS113]|nr:putative spermidine/putrescine transport system permease protein [Rhizobiales bacterium GAS113]
MSSDLTRGALSLFVLLFFVFLVAPILIVVIVSFSSQSYVGFPLTGLSLKWYWRIWEYRPFIDSMITSTELALASAFCGAVLAVPAAIGLSRSDSSAAAALVSFLMSPLSVPAVMLGFALLYYLSWMGFGVSFLSLLIAHTIIAIPYILRTVIAGYRGMGPTCEEAARSLGAGPLRCFWHVTFPLVRPSIFAGALFAVLISFDNLPISFFFGNASTNTLPVVMLSYLQNQFDPAIAAIGTAQMGLAFVLLIVVERIYGLKALSAA